MKERKLPNVGINMHSVARRFVAHPWKPGFDARTLWRIWKMPWKTCSRTGNMGLVSSNPFNLQLLGMMIPRHCLSWLKPPREQNERSAICWVLLVSWWIKTGVALLLETIGIRHIAYQLGLSLLACSTFTACFFCVLRAKEVLVKWSTDIQVIK